MKKIDFEGERNYYGSKVLTLTDYGTLSNGKTDYSIYDFVKTCKKYFQYVESFNYDNYQFDFVIYPYLDNPEFRDIKEHYIIYLSNTLTNNMKNGIIDDDVQLLLNLVEEKKLLLKKERINEEVLESGEFPTEPEEIYLYTEYLEEQLKNVRTEVTWSCRRLTSPLVLVPTSIVCALGTDKIGNLSSPMAVSLFVGSILCCAYSVSYLVEDKHLKDLAILKDNYKKSKMLYYKLLKLKLHIEEQNLSSEKTFRQLQGEENKDNYPNCFSKTLKRV